MSSASDNIVSNKTQQNPREILKTFSTLKSKLEETFPCFQKNKVQRSPPALLRKFYPLFNIPDITCIVLWRKLAEVEKHIEHKIIRESLMTTVERVYSLCRVHPPASPPARPISATKAVICLQPASLVVLTQIAPRSAKSLCTTNANEHI